MLNSLLRAFMPPSACLPGSLVPHSLTDTSPEPQEAEGAGARPVGPVVGCFSAGVFTRIVAAALAPLQKQGMKVLPYLDDWLFCALSQSQVAWDTAWLLLHTARLGLISKLPGPISTGHIPGDCPGLRRYLGG